MDHVSVALTSLETRIIAHVKGVAGVADNADSTKYVDTPIFHHRGLADALLPCFSSFTDAFMHILVFPVFSNLSHIRAP